MGNISDLSDELLVKILSFLPTKVAVSTSILSKQWEFLWMWLPNLKFYCTSSSMRDFINKNLPLHKAPVIETLCLTNLPTALEAENFKSWVEIAVSHDVRELICINYDLYSTGGSLVLPSSLYTCKSLVTLKLEGKLILVDVPQTVCLPALKTLQLSDVTYANEDSLRLLLSFCHVLEDLTIERHWKDNMKELVIIMPSLQRLSLVVNADDEDCSSYEYKIVTPSLKYFKVEDLTDGIPYLIDDMPNLEEADISLMKDNEGLFVSIRTAKRLSLRVGINYEDDSVYGGGIDFSQLENLKLYICGQNWSQLLFLLLIDSPNLQTLDLQVDDYQGLSDEEEDSLVCWGSNQSLVPECLLKSLKVFNFKGSTDKNEERDVLSFIIKHACCLNFTSILRTAET